MLVIRDPAAVKTIGDPAIRGPVERRFAEILAGETCDDGLFSNVDTGQSCAEGFAASRTSLKFLNQDCKVSLRHHQLMCG